MRKKLLYALPLLCSTILLISTSASAASFNQNQIIDDATFDNVNSMSASQIDSFLNSFPNSCISPASGFQAIDPTGYNPSAGYQYGGYVTAGQVIYDAAQAYTINPQVLLTTLQKEQSLVIGAANFCSNGDENKYAAAAGYGCPDSGTTYSYTGLSLYQRNGAIVSSVGPTCVNSASKAGFSQQVIRAAWLLKFGEQRSEGRVSWAVIKGSWDNSDDPQTCYGGPMTQGTYQRCPSGATAYYDGYTTIDGTAVHMDTGATAALYWYTPHFHGNQSFFSIYTGWFGDTISDVYPWQVATASGGDGKYYLIVGNTKRWIPNGQIYTDWGLDKYPLQQVSSGYLNGIPTIPDLGRLGLTKSGQYVFVDSGQKYNLSAAAIADWGYAGSLPIAAPINSLLSALPTAGDANQFVKESGTSNYYLMSAGTLYPINASYLGRWGATAPTVISTTTSAMFTKSSTLDYRLSIGGKNYVTDSGKLLDISNPAAANAFAPLFSASVNISSTVLPFFTTQVASPLVQASNSGNWEYLLGGQQHYVLNADIARAWGASQPPQVISPELLASFTTGGLLSTHVQATDSGTYYVLDGSKHVVPSSLVPDWFGSNAPAMLVVEAAIPVPQGSTVSSPIFQNGGTGDIYAAINGQYDYIQTGAILNGYGYPAKYGIVTVNSAVLSSMSFGGALNQFLTNNGTTYYLQDGTAYPLAAADIGSWTNGASVLAYPGSDFTQRFSPSATVLTNLITNSSQKWLVDSGKLLDVSRFSDAYSFTNWSNMSVANLPRVNGLTTYLVRSTTLSDSRVWLINKGTKQWLTNLEQYDGFGGAKLQIMQLSDATLASIPLASPDSNPSIIIKAGSSGLKLLMNGEFYAFPDADTLVNTIGSNGVTDVSPSIFSQLGGQVGNMSRLIKDASNGKIYHLENGQKRWITNGNAYAAYAGMPVTTLPSEVINWFPEGSPII